MMAGIAKVPPHTFGPARHVTEAEKAMLDKIDLRAIKIEAAARKVVEEMDRIHDTSDAPLKFRAPFGAIAELRKVLETPTA